MTSPTHRGSLTNSSQETPATAGQAPDAATEPVVRVDSPYVRNLYRLVGIAGLLFVITVLATTANLFGNTEAPVTKFLDRYGTWIILAEVGLIMVLGVTAMRADQLQFQAGPTVGDPRATGQGEMGSTDEPARHSPPTS